MRLAMLMVVCLVIGNTGVFTQWGSPKPMAGDEGCNRGAERREERRATGELGRAKQVFRTGVRWEWVRFERAVRQCAQAKFASIRSKVATIAGLYNCDKAWHLAKVLAQDKVEKLKPSRAERLFISDLSGRFCAPLLEARRSVWNECQVLEIRLAALRRQYADRVRAIVQSSRGTPESAPPSGEPMKDVQGMAKKRMSPVGDATETAILGPVVEAASRVLDHAVTRLAAQSGTRFVALHPGSAEPTSVDMAAAIRFGANLALAYDDAKAVHPELSRQIVAAMGQVVDAQEKEIVEMALYEGHGLWECYSRE